MIYRKFIIAASALSMLTGAVSAVADENRREGEHASIGIRRLGPEAESYLIEQSEQAECRGCPKKHRGNKKKHGAFWNRTHNAAKHIVEQTRVQSIENVRLEDGSIWSVHEDDRAKIENWGGSVVTIVPHRTFIFKSKHLFRIVNERTGTSVRANITIGPIIGLHRYIADIDPVRQEVYLNDDSVWTVSDPKILNDWVVEDIVILGTNNSWFSSYPNIIVNINTDPVTYIKARFHH